MNKYWIALLLLTSMPVLASPYVATPAELAMCQTRVYSRIGGRDENTAHMHHYCDGLRFLDRAYATMGDKKEFNHNINRSVGGFNYVLSHTQESYSMRGEVHVGKARALKLMGKRAEAVAELFKALRYKLDSPDAYQALADHYQETGDKQKALEMVTEGLKRAPNSKGLKRRYSELGGKLPYPEPIQDTPIETAQPLPEVVESPPKVEATGVEGITPNAPGSATEVAAPKIGSPKNPYCRFCPD